MATTGYEQCGMTTERHATALFAGGFAIATALTVVATVFAISGVGASGPAGPPLFGLLVASLLIAMALGVVLALRIVRIIGQRNVPQRGARLQLRFVALFSAAAVIPAILVALFLGAIMNRGMESWFSVRVQTTMESAGTVGRRYVENAKNSLAGRMLAMASDLNYAENGLTSEPALFQDFLLKQTSFREFDSAYLVQRNGEVLAAARVTADPSFSVPNAAAFDDAALGQPSLMVFEDAGMIRGLVRLTAYPDAFLYVARAEPLLRQLRVFDDSLQAYRSAEDHSRRLQALFGLAYLNVALLVLLGAVWLGLMNAMRLSEPIGRLADAAGRVASGDLTARVAVGLERDEVDALGSAFNRMTSQIEAQRADLVKARQEAEERSSFTQTVLANVSAGVLGLDDAGRITAVNNSAAGLLQVQEGGLEGRRLVEIAPEFAEIVRAAQESPSLETRRIDIARVGGTIHLSVRATALGAEEGVVLTFDDMTKLVAAQRQEAWKDVARRIAHEIKNPLTPIQLSAERLRRKYLSEIKSDPDTFQRCTDTILRQVADIGRMVDEFSGFARMPAPRIERVDIAEIARESVFAQRLSHADIRFDVEGATEPLFVECDGRLIAQALTNLLKNAAEAIGARRTATGEPKEGHVLLRLEASGDRDVRLAITDNGVGLPLVDRARLVEPYVTTRAKGTGLGLAIVKRVVEDHGGALGLSDSPMPGPGAMISITLPLSPPIPDDPALQRQETSHVI
jgi:two-component system nitrogen regulation sensor histidine kinase NtrY